MIDPITYTLSYGASKLNLLLTDDRFVSKGSMQNVDIPLSALRYFCIVPTKSDLGAAYDSQLVLSWDEAGKVKSKKLMVRNTDVSFKQFLSSLEQRRPDASLLNLNPDAAQKKMGVTSTKKLAWIIALAIVGIILLAAVIVGFAGGSGS
jgi:hypothetical protein